MKGTVRKRGATWGYQFPVVEAGKRRQISKGGFRTQRLAQDALGDAIAKYRRGEYVEPSRLTLEDYLTREWLPLQDAGKKPSTVYGYRNIVKSRLIPHLGAVRLTELGPGDIAALYATLRATGLAEGSIRNAHVCLNAAMEHAVDTGLMVRNPAGRLPRSVRPRIRSAEMKTWTAEQVRAFLTATDADRLGACYAVATMTGLRRSELLALKWEDANLEAGQLAVRRGLVAAGAVVTEGEPKSGRARTVSLDPGTAAVLRRHRARQLEDRLAWGREWTDSGRVFTREDGNDYRPGWVSRTFDRAVAHADVPRIRFHDLRHTSASLMLAAGVHPKVVQERLGHASIKITLDLYSHVAPGMQDDAAAKLGRIVFGA